MKFILTILFLCVFFKIQGQTIVTLPLLASEFCQGEGIRVPFTVSGAFSTDNIFTAQISTANGDFILATGIGFVYGFNPDTINAVIPLEIASGTGYRIRVVSSAPYVEGIDNGIDLTVLELPQVNFQTIDTICFGDLPFELAGGTPVGGFYFGPGVEADTFFSEIAGFGSHQLTYTFTAPNGCSAFDVDTIFVKDCSTLVKNLALAGRVKLFPNPARGEVTLLAEGAKVTSLTIMAMDGQVIRKTLFTENNIHSVSISDIPPGIYMVYIDLGLERVVKKMVIF
jgi:hypothetical protein